jgi:uroporphyrinogen III methyltransferase / synthase
MEKPLQSKRVVVTRAPEQARELCEALRVLGAEVLLMPTVSFAAAEDTAPVDAAIRRMGEFDWLVFTSQNAVRFFSQRAAAVGVGGGGFGSARLSVAAVGPATSGAAAEAGFRVTYLAKNPSGEALASELTRFVGGKTVLLPRSNRGDDRFLRGLREAGAKVTDVTAYRTLPPGEVNAEALARVRNGEVDAVLFASPSAFHNLCDAIPAAELAQLSSKVNFAAIGATTAKALRDAGVRVAIQPAQASAILLADALGKFYARRAAGVESEAKTA